jgi:hypothetical protein
VRRRLLVFLSLLFAAAALVAQEAPQYRIELPEGTNDVWVGEPSELVNFTGFDTTEAESVTQTLEGEVGDQIVAVRNEDGVIYTKPLAEVAERGWTVEPEDATHLDVIGVRVTHEDRPVVGGAVKLSIDDYVAQQLIGDGDDGTAYFEIVPLGQASLTYEYRVEGETRETPPQVFAIGPQSTPSGTVLGVIVNEEVPTVRSSRPGEVGLEGIGEIQRPVSIPEGETRDGAPETGGAPEGPAVRPEEEAGSANPLGQLIATLLVLAVIVIVGFFIFNYIKSNPSQVKGALGKVGVNVPDPSPDDGDSGNAPAQPSKPEPQKQILLDGASPDPVGQGPGDAPHPVTPAAGVASAGAAAGGVSNPRLVSDSGDAFLITEGQPLIVGREPDKDLPLEGESTVSRNHAELTREGDNVKVKDLGSTNGTYVNGQKLDVEVALQPGDTVQFGSVRYRYEA